MLSAFTAEPIIELKQRDRSKIEAILSHGDQLLVGLSTGSLRIYRVNSSPSRDEDDSPKSERHSGKEKRTDLLREYEKFSKNKVEQLAVFKEANILLSLSGGLVSIHDLGSFEPLETLTKTKGASTFATTSNIVNDATSGVPGLVSRLAVAVKRRLLLWSWHDGELAGDAQEIALASGIKSITWATSTKMVVGLSSHYVFVNIETQEVKTISGPGSIGGGSEQETSRLGGVGAGTMSYLGMGSMVPNPLATSLGENEMLLARDINTQFIDRNGDPIRRRQVPWRPAPQAVGYSYPFLLSLQESSRGIMEVRNPQTLTLLQSIELPHATLLQVPSPNISLAHQGKGFLVASDRGVWRMKGLSYDTQIDSLVELGYYDEAISLLGMIEETLVNNGKARMRDVKMQKAQHLFDEKNYREALEIFGTVLAPPEQVIKMYPEIISGPLSVRHGSPSSPKKGHQKAASIISFKKQKKGDSGSISSGKNGGDEMTEKELKQAVYELQAFLADIRRRLQRFFNADQSTKDVTELQESSAEDTQEVAEYLLGIEDLNSPQFPEKLLETATLVDTTLFRAHMFVTPSLAGSLFRIANFCDPDVVMDRLEASKRYSDVIDFLYGKKLHKQALGLLQKFGNDEKTEAIDPQLRGPQRTVTYLQNLPPEYIDLILEFARWPVETKPALGMEIFLTDTENAENLPRNKVLSFLESIDKDLALRYLEHVIEELDDKTPELHQMLVQLYLEKIKALPQDAKEATNDLLRKFVTILRTSTQYSPARILSSLPQDDPKFYESTAIIFSKMGQQKQALQVYVFKIHDIVKAEEYCNEVYMEESVQTERALASSRRKPSIITKDPTDEKPSIYHHLLNLYLNPPNGEKALIGPAIDLMARHGPRLPASSTLEMIPKDLLVKELEFYLRGRIRNANTVMNDSKVIAGLRKVEAIRVSAALLLGEDDATIQSNGGRQRKVKVDEDKVCRVCYKRLGSSVISVFPEYFILVRLFDQELTSNSNSVVHLGCASRRQRELNP